VNTFLPLGVSVLMDKYDDLWRYVFVSFALIHLLNLILILRLKVPASIQTNVQNISFKSLVVEPIKKGWNLVKMKPEFMHYIFIYCLGGAGIIAIQPMLPTYFKETLHLSYTQLAVAFSFCKGIAFISSSPIWARYMQRISLYTVNIFMNVFSCLFLILMMTSSLGMYWLFPAYLCYGTMQAGTEMSWNMSGPIISRRQDSTLYSTVNLGAIGIRGCICPIFGYLLFTYTNSLCVFAVAFLLCFSCIVYGSWLNRHYYDKTRLFATA
jgi:predicted MFS family arabinose efflux permease